MQELIEHEKEAEIDRQWLVEMQEESLEATDLLDDQTYEMWVE